MVVTEVRIKLMGDGFSRLLAFCSITFDDMFVVRDLKIIDGTRGPFIAFPSRKLTDRCPNCTAKNFLRARYCNGCGCKLDEERATRDMNGHAKLHADIAHPINRNCRTGIQSTVIKAFEEERQRSMLPGYVCRYDDYGDSESDDGDESEPMPSYGRNIA